MPSGWLRLQVRRIAACCVIITGRDLSSGHADGIPECPVGSFRKALLVFPCTPDGVERSYQVVTWVTENQTEVIGRIPPGLKSLEIASTSPAPVWLELFNADARNPDDTTGIGYKDLLGYRQEGSTSYSFYDITVTNDIEFGDGGSVPYKDVVQFFGALPVDLLAALRYNTETQSEARMTLTYSYEGSAKSDCPVGCAKYVAKEAAATLAEFSAWIDAQYDGLHMQAFEDLGLLSHFKPRAETLMGFLHFHDWPRIWSRWPSGAEHPWQASFNLVDSLIERDGLVSEDELVKAFSFHTVQPSLSIWSGILHGAGNSQTADEAWNSLYNASVGGISEGDWTSKWDVWPAPQDLNKVSGATTFEYVDSDGDGWISQDEFRVAYEVFYMGTPLMLREIHEDIVNLSQAIDDDAVPTPRYTVTPKQEATVPNISSEDDADSSSDMSESSSESSGEAGSFDGGGLWLAAIIASIVAIIVSGALCVVALLHLKGGKSLRKEKRHGLTPGPSESRLSREVRTQNNRPEYSPVTPSGDHSMESVPPPSPEWHQDQFMEASGAPQHLPSPTAMLSPIAPALMYSYATVPGQNPQHLTPQPSPHRPLGSGGYAYVQYPQPQYFSPAHSQQVAPHGWEPAPDGVHVQY